MAIVQDAFYIPDDIATGLATGLYRRIKRLDMYRTAIRDKVSHAINTDELDHIFDTDGVIE